MGLINDERGWIGLPHGFEQGLVAAQINGTHADRGIVFHLPRHENAQPPIARRQIDGAGKIVFRQACRHDLCAQHGTAGAIARCRLCDQRLQP